MSATGTAIACDARYLVMGIRRDVSAEFSADAAFSVDGVAARATARVD